MKVKAKLYRIPFWERFTVANPPLSRAKYLHVDNVGLLVYYDDKEELNHVFIRRRLIGKRHTHCLVEANHPAEAIRTFREEWEGAKIGGEGEEYKALWINKEEEILELPHCELLEMSLRKNGELQFTCGKLQESGNGEFGMCILEQYDAPDECPIGDFYDQIFERREQGNLFVVRVQGYKVILAKNVMEQG